MRAEDGSTRRGWCSKAGGLDVSSAAAGLMVVGLFQQSDEGDTTMAERARTTAAQLADKLLSDEHADVCATRGRGMDGPAAD
jgi:hypothetical protein